MKDLCYKPCYNLCYNQGRRKERVKEATLYTPSRLRHRCGSLEKGGLTCMLMAQSVQAGV